MKDRMSTSNFESNNSNDEFTEYIQGLVIEVIQNGESFDKYKKWLKKYCDEYNADYNLIESLMVDLFELVNDYNNSNSNVVKRMIYKTAKDLSLNEDTVSQILLKTQASPKNLVLEDSTSSENKMIDLIQQMLVGIKNEEYENLIKLRDKKNEYVNKLANNVLSNVIINNHNHERPTNSNIFSSNSFYSALFNHNNSDRPYLLIDYTKGINDIPISIYGFPKSKIDDLGYFNLTNKDYHLSLFENLSKDPLSVMISFAVLLKNHKYPALLNYFPDFYKKFTEIIPQYKEFQLVDFFKNPIDNKYWFEARFKNKKNDAIEFWKDYIIPIFRIDQIFNSELFYFLISRYSNNTDKIITNKKYSILHCDSTIFSSTEIDSITELAITNKIHHAVKNNLNEVNIFFAGGETDDKYIKETIQNALLYYSSQFKGVVNYYCSKSPSETISLHSHSSFNTHDKAKIICEISTLTFGLKTPLILKESNFRMNYHNDPNGYLIPVDANSFRKLVNRIM